MLRNYFVINLILVIILGLLGAKFYGIAMYSMNVPTAASVESGGETAGIDIKLKNKVPDKAAFNIISGNDLFRPSRSASLTDDRKIQKIGRDRYPKLFATIIQSRNSTAILEDPETKKTKTYRVNDIIIGFRILEIMQDRVVLLKGDEQIDLKLRADKGIKSVRPKPLTRKSIQQKTIRRPAPIRRSASDNGS